MTRQETIGWLKYIADSPSQENGGFNPQTVEIAKSALKLLENKKDICTWKYDIDYDYYHTDCGEDFTLMDGTPYQNKMRYCYRCGRKLKATR